MEYSHLSSDGEDNGVIDPLDVVDADAVSCDGVDQEDPYHMEGDGLTDHQDAGFHHVRTTSVLHLAVVCFFIVAGGPQGIEPVVKAAGPGPAWPRR